MGDIDAAIDQLTKSPADDAITVIARAIREYFKGDEEKMKIPWSRQMAEVIDSGFLDGILAQKAELIKRSENQAREKQDELRHIVNRLAVRRDELANIESQIKTAKEELETIVISIEKKGEPDAVLASAKRAYNWIFQKTRRYELASKAFNSYLLGQNAKHDEYETQEEV